MAGKLTGVKVPFEKIKSLQDQIDREGPPREIAVLNREIADAMQNLEALTILFGGIVDQGAVQRVVDLKIEKDCTYTRLMLAQPDAA
jgi:hypothetical protein